jgi:hypothetical protein
MLHLSFLSEIRFKSEVSLYEATEASGFVRRRGSHILWTVDIQMAVNLSALHAGRGLPPRNIPDDEANNCQTKTNLKYGHRSQRGAQYRLTVGRKISSNLTSVRLR